MPFRDLVSGRLVAAQLVLLSFAICWLTEMQLYDARALFQEDVWFGADPDVFTTELLDVRSAPFRHPNVSVFFGLPLLLVERGLLSLGVSSGRPDGLHMWLVLLIAPSAAAIRTLAAFTALRTLTRRLWISVLVALLDIVAFQTVALGSVPETYPLSAASIAGMYWLVARDGTRGQISYGAWVLLGTVAVGITLTNGLPFAVLLTTSELRCRSGTARVLTRVALASGLVLAITAVLATGRTMLAGRDVRAATDVAGTQDYIRRPTGGLARDLAWAMVQTFLPPPPGRGTRPVASGNDPRL